MSIQNVFDINVDLKQSTVIKTPIITKNDTVVFNVHVYDDGKVFDISSGTTYSIFSKRPDGQVIGKAGTVVGQNTIQFPLGTSETSVPGVVSATIQIYDANGRVSTFPFCYQVLDDPSVGYVKSSTEITLLQSLINNTQDAIDRVNAAATKANDAASSANAAATNANNVANNANTKASYAQTQGDYAKTQGDYAKAQGDYVKEQVDAANAAATSATNSANSANTAASNANEAAKNATNAANSANNAAEAATNAASNANEAAKNATNAANSANTAANNANNAAKAANAAAANAQSVADNTKYIEEYNPNTQYQKNNIVTYNGSSFIAKTATLGHTPVGGSSDPYWALLAKKGVDGKGSVSTVNNVYPDNNGNVELTPADIGAETPLNAQKKADQAEQNAKAYVDAKLSTYQLSDFIKKAGDAITGDFGTNYNIDPAKVPTLDGSKNARIAWNRSGGDGEVDLISSHGSGNSVLRVYRRNSDGTLTERFRVGTTDAFLGENKIWHQGNDGSGSGLDADLLDGLDSSAFVKKAGDKMTGALTVPNLVAQINIPSSSPPSAWPAGFVAGVVYNNGYPVQYGTIFSYKGTTVNSVVQLLQAWPGKSGGEAYLYIRSARDVGEDVFGPWRKVWSENNDGEGSGLDADTVDGKQASDFVWKTEKGQPNGVATLGADGKVPAEQLSSDAATKDELTHLNLNIIDMAVELETLKGATLNGVTANIFIETFTNLNDINLMNGIYDSKNKRLVL